MKVSNRFQKMSEIYRIFSNDWKDTLDYSQEALVELYQAESLGGVVSPNNGFSIGKMYLNLHVTMWKEDIAKGYFFKKELYDDPKFPHWWLDSIFGT